jgi:hypothetical protein
MSESTVYAVEYLRPDGWDEAGRGWEDRGSAERDASEQFPPHVKWRVVEAAADDSDPGTREPRP